MPSIKDLTKLADSSGKIIDNVHYSSQEKDTSINTRHNVDMISDSWLSKNIRPLTLLFLLLCQAVLIIGWMYGIKPDNILTGQIGTLLFGAFSFYFNSKKGERIAEKNAKANIEIVKMEMEMNKKKERAARRLERIKARKD
jgi:hypothetical protein|tara:strand:- start:60 stop:482 length:423 start_codon:yes stop_codon:yes gene_type:complete